MSEKPQFKVTYLLVKPTQYQAPAPIPCVGRSGKHYGHYTWEPRYRGMVKRFTEAEWFNYGENGVPQVGPRGTLAGAGVDVVAKMGQFTRPTFYVEIELVGDLAAREQELFDSRFRIETLTARLEDALQAFGQASIEAQELLMLRAKLDKALAIPGAPTETQIEKAIEEDLARYAQAAETARQTAIRADPLALYEEATDNPDAFEQLGGANSPAHIPTQAEKDNPDFKMLSAKNHRQLRELCRGAVAAGAKISLTNPRKEQMIAALLKEPEFLRAAFSSVTSG